MSQQERLVLLRKVLKPIARFCARNSMTIQEVIEALKFTLVEAAEEQLKSLEAKSTTSRIAIMTGLTRKDVVRVQTNEDPVAGPVQSLSARIIGYWENSPRFRAKLGVGRILTYEGDRSEFKDMVNSVSSDLNPATVLFELQRLGIVERIDGNVRLVSGEARLQATTDKGLNLLSRDIETLAMAAQENIESPKESKNIHLRTECDNLFEDDLPLVRRWLLNEGKKFHNRLRIFLAKHDADFHSKRKGRARMRAVIGTFSWTSQPLENPKILSRDKKRQLNGRK